MAPNFWPLWIAQRDILLRQCLRLMSGNMDDAQDALSEAMIKASVKFEDSMDEIRNHRAWLSRIVHNACIDLHRQNRRKADYNEETHSKEDNVLPGISRQEEATPEQNALTGETFSNLERALTDLPEKLRRPLLMRCVQDQSYDEIAENLGLSNCAVRKRVQLARDHLKGFDIR
ncbi:RNA polymerase sigma factor [Thalassospira sp. TSL5-1]|uniref:RNA polymerase sigma factor n=1 Tax=Thalassospira sp. TSL5-1 TaxID=1544451 RepID=UPI00093B082E|nr:sigma-70 family RNA polymerase sigma factor [Thalassospira sp. TSL5-1]